MGLGRIRIWVWKLLGPNPRNEVRLGTAFASTSRPRTYRYTRRAGNKKPLQNTCKGFYWVAVPFFSRSAEKRRQTGEGYPELYHGDIRYAQRRPRLWQFLYTACNPLLLQRTFSDPHPLCNFPECRAHNPSGNPPNQAFSKSNFTTQRTRIKIRGTKKTAGETRGKKWRALRESNPQPSDP